MHIDLDSEDFIIELKLGGEIYKLKEPTEKQISAYSKELKENSDEAIPAFKKMLVSLGLPQDKADELGIFKVKKIMNVLSKELEEKK